MTNEMCPRPGHCHSREVGRTRCCANCQTGLLVDELVQRASAWQGAAAGLINRSVAD